ncbi:MAG: lamin tail domain-containing protein, partial [Sandaracinaceae bacterium]|nr:lamin tail domain-containing protein [Sandaracinaceae bacterium]
MRKGSALFLPFLVGFALEIAFLPLSALAHPVTIDGRFDDWFGPSRQPNGQNLGILAKNSSGGGELIWVDARGDARTDLMNPELDADLHLFAVTADPRALYFRLAFGGGTSPPVQIQIALDFDRMDGNGNLHLAGFAETEVEDSAAWEFLIQTRGGLSGGSVRIRNRSYADIGTGMMAANAMGNEVEIAVPWERFPAEFRNPNAMRMTVAIFRENSAGDTAEIPDASDALDVISDYGDPRGPLGTQPNTWEEVMDGRVNHSLELWLDRTTREPYSPLVVSRFMSNAPSPASEWVEVRNNTPFSLDLSLFAIGDEETVDQTAEFMGTFPAGSTLASGSTAVIALQGSSAFMNSYGVSPNFEVMGAGGPPDLVRLSVWSPSGSFALANDSDEIFVLGWKRTIIDVVTYGTATYAGVVPRSALPANVIAVRNPVTSDTDNCMVDFELTFEDCGPMAGTCGPCQRCERWMCVVVVEGTPCDDGDACTINDRCNAMGRCVGTPACDGGSGRDGGIVSIADASATDAGGDAFSLPDAWRPDAFMVVDGGVDAWRPDAFMVV